MPHVGRAPRQFGAHEIEHAVRIDAEIRTAAPDSKQRASALRSQVRQRIINRQQQAIRNTL
jgi:hypothetical protein